MNLIELSTDKRDVLPVREHRNPVRAVKILGIGARRIDGVTVVLDGLDEPLHLTPAELDRLFLREGDYFVVYADGAVGCSPAVAFEELAEPDPAADADPPLTAAELLADWDELDSDQDRAEYHEILSEEERNILTHALSDRAAAAHANEDSGPPASGEAAEEGGEDLD